MYLAYTLSTTFFSVPQLLIHQNLIHGNPKTVLKCNSNWPSCRAACVSNIHRESSSFMRLLCCIIWVSLFRSRLLAWTLRRGLRTTFSWKKKHCWGIWSLEKVVWAVHSPFGVFYSVLRQWECREDSEDTGDNILVGSDPRPEGFRFQKPKQLSLETKRKEITELHAVFLSYWNWHLDMHAEVVLDCGFQYYDG